jgi:hypothetical protein
MKTMKKMMTFLAVAGLVLALAPAAQAATVITPTGVSSTDPFSSFVPTSLINVLDTAFVTDAIYGVANPYYTHGTTLQTYDPDAAENASNPQHGQGTGNAGLTYIGLAGDIWSGTIAIPAGSTLDFLDVWGTIPGGGTGHFDNSRDLVFTLSDGVNTWSSAPWNGVYYTAGSGISPAGPGFGRFDFLGAAVTDDLLLNATTFSISSTSDKTQLDEIRLVASVAVPVDPTITLDGDSVSENVAPGTAVGSLSVVATNATFDFSLVETLSGPFPGNDSFDLTGVSLSNVVTKLVLDADDSPIEIRVLATETSPNAGFTLTNTFSITISSVTETDHMFANAEVQSTTTLAATLEATAAATYLVTAGEHHGAMFVSPVVGNELHLKTAATAGQVGDEYFVEVTSSLGDSMLIKVTVVSGAPAGTVFMFR